MASTSNRVDREKTRILFHAVFFTLTKAKWQIEIICVNNNDRNKTMYYTYVHQTQNHTKTQHRYKHT